jgi:hypothetical protein
MLLRGVDHPVHDGDPIDWLRGEISKSSILTLTDLRDARWVQSLYARKPGLGQRQGRVPAECPRAPSLMAAS